MVRSLAFHEFQPVSERITNISTIVAVQWLIDDGSKTRAFQSRDEPNQITDQQAWMRLPRWNEVCFYAEMDFDVVPLEPAPPSRSQLRWPRNLPKPK